MMSLPRTLDAGRRLSQPLLRLERAGKDVLLECWAVELECWWEEDSLMDWLWKGHWKVGRLEDAVVRLRGAEGALLLSSPGISGILFGSVGILIFQ